MPANSIPITLLTGFLGSGKTTVLNHLVQHPRLARTLVIINEFGEVGLDHLLMSRVADDTLIEMSSGCLCCTIRGDLVSTLKDAHWRFSRAGERWFDRVIIETTGLADPAPIIQTLTSVAAITRRYQLDGVATTVDLTNAEATLDRQPEALKQAAMADCLLLTKSDLAGPDATAKLEERLSRINPAARRLKVAQGVVAPDALLGLGLFDPATKIPDVARWLNEEAYLVGSETGSATNADHPYPTPVSSDEHEGEHHGVTHGAVSRAQGHDHHPGHDHDPNRHDDHISAFCLVIEGPIEQGAFDAWLAHQLSLAGADMLRIKGMLNIRGRSGPVVVHGVQHVQHAPVELPSWPDDDHRSKLVFITRDIPRDRLKASLDGFLGTRRRPRV
jgi:G3E family GTPase